MSDLQSGEAAAAAVAVAPRVTLADIEAKIAAVYFLNGEGFAMAAEYEPHTVWAPQPLACLTLCVVVLVNGFTVVGKSAPASAENFDADLGKRFAREDALRQVWTLEGYALRTRLSEEAAVS